MRNGRHSNDRRSSRHGGGGGGGNGGGGGRGGRGRRGGGGGGGHNGGGRRRHHRNPRTAAEGGNKRERIAIESGFLVLIDQFMLANPEFVDRLAGADDSNPDLKDDIVSEFGGVVIALQPGTYRIDRDPFQYVIVVHPEGEEVHEPKAIVDEATESRGEVFVDTRCLAMIDRELLDDTELLQKYQELWFSGQDKACRDLLRDNGGAVRYGFQRYGDELEVKSVADRDIVCLVPNAATLATLKPPVSPEQRQESQEQEAAAEQ